MDGAVVRGLVAIVLVVMAPLLGGCRQPTPEPPRTGAAQPPAFASERRALSTTAAGAFAGEPANGGSGSYSIPS